jgi:hypothetical protein
MTGTTEKLTTTLFALIFEEPMAKFMLIGSPLRYTDFSVCPIDVREMPATGAVLDKKGS